MSLRRCEGKAALRIDEARLVEETAKACARISEEFGIRPVLIPMQPQNDREICRQTAERIHALVGRESACTVEPETAGELVGILSRARFVVGMRLHTLIFSVCARVPVVGLSYDPKISSLMKRLEQPYSLSARDLTAEEIFRCAEEIMGRREAIAETVSRHVGDMVTLCHEDVRRAAALLK